MDRLARPHSNGLSGNALRTWGILFLTAGIIGRCIFQNKFLNISGLTGEELLQVMSGSQSAMAAATAALVMQALETCAAPLFAFLLVEGFTHTKNWKKYFLRVTGVALLSEIPYNLAMSGTFLDTASRNPVFSLVIGLLVLYFYQRFSEKTGMNTMIRFFVTLAALLWVGMLQIDQGVPVLVLTAVFWLLRGKPKFRTLVGCIAAVVCSLVSPFYMASPMGCMPIHFYNQEPGERSKIVNYLAYPVILTAVYLVSILAF